ncbi:MAG: type II toxin-antitoxin system RelB/DinJ family antitoxin [Bacteroidales bacterium]|jgi:antitoxin component of RelBE/YafQ-DinJ toxin-antitoxin module|nr:type II toxin-antitoxin system RelB/DinJ family antitoxin [Bacteroidales bacterium]
MGYTYNIDTATKNSFDLLCARFGVTADKVISLFIKQSVQTQEISVRLEELEREIMLDSARNAIEEMREQSEVAGNSVMSLEEINEEIRQARRERKLRNS